MKIPMHKEDFVAFEKVSKEPGYTRIKYTIEKRESDPNYLWIYFDVNEHQLPTLLLLMHHSGKRYAIDKYLKL